MSLDRDRQDSTGAAASWRRRPERRDFRLVFRPQRPVPPISLTISEPKRYLFRCMPRSEFASSVLQGRQLDFVLPSCPCPSGYCLFSNYYLSVEVLQPLDLEQQQSSRTTDKVGLLNTMASRPLYGGACWAQIPQGWADMSDSRPVPDTQEVFMAQDGSRALRLSLSAPTPLTTRLPCHFDDVADAAAVSRAVVATGSTLRHGSGLRRRVGQHDNDKGREHDEGDSADVGIAAFRFPDEATDVLCTLNVPALDGSCAKGGAPDLAAPGMRPPPYVVVTVVDRGLFGGENAHHARLGAGAVVAVSPHPRAGSRPRASAPPSGATPCGQVELGPRVLRRFYGHDVAVVELVAELDLVAVGRAPGRDGGPRPCV